MNRQVMDLGGMLAGKSPFSFVYGGIDSATLLPAWSHDGNKEAGRSDRALKVMTYTDPVTRLEVRYELTHFEDCSAFDWTVTFTNTGTVDSASSQQLTGAELTHLKVDIRSVPGSLLVLYRKVK
jgi:hypothetical protein